MAVIKVNESFNFKDEGWPNLPDLKKYNHIDIKIKLKLLKDIKNNIVDS